MSSLHSEPSPLRSRLTFLRHWASPVVVSLVLVVLTTSLVWAFLPRLQHEHVIFIYFVPTAFIAIRYGNVSAFAVAICSTIAAAFFIYPPRFSFAMASGLEATELVLFCLLGLLASQVVSGFAKDSMTVKRTRHSGGKSFAAPRPGLRTLLSRLRK